MYKYEIVEDNDPLNPRKDYDNLGTILYVSRSRTLGDERVDADKLETVQADSDLICLPVYAYIHGDICLSTSPFGCRWDSGQCGVIYVSKENVMKEWKCDAITPELHATVENTLRGEVEVFGVFLNGGVCGWHVLDDSGDVVESCYGYFYRDSAVADAKECIAHLAARDVEAAVVRGRQSEHSVMFG